VVQELQGVSEDTDDILEHAAFTADESDLHKK
jgi:hypothetical protein